MATEPKNIRESNIAMQGVVDRLDLVQKITWAIVAMLGTLIAGAAAIYFQIGEIRTDVAVLKANLASLKEQQSSIQETLRSTGEKTLASLSQIESKLPVRGGPISQPDDAPLTLSDSDIELIRNVLKPLKTGQTQEAKLGDEVPDRNVRVLPRTVTDKIPRLASYSYFHDAGGSVVLVSNRTRRVVQIIEPA